MNLHLKANYVLISVMGPHASESEQEIFDRKISDIEKIGKTFWLIRSRCAKPDMVQAICSEAKNANQEVYCLFIDPSSRGGSTPTKTSVPARMYSEDERIWPELPQDLSPVTGKIDRNAYAIIFDNLEVYEGLLDLWNFADFNNLSEPLRIAQGASTLCAVRKDMSTVPNSKKIKSRHRNIVAIGRLCEPYGVWLR